MSTSPGISVLLGLSLVLASARGAAQSATGTSSDPSTDGACKPAIERLTYRRGVLSISVRLGCPEQRQKPLWVGWSLHKARGGPVWYDLPAVKVAAADLKRPVTLKADVGPGWIGYAVGLWGTKVAPCEKTPRRAYSTHDPAKVDGCKRYGYVLDDDLGTIPSGFSYGVCSEGSCWEGAWAPLNEVPLRIRVLDASGGREAVNGVVRRVKDFRMMTQLATATAEGGDDSPEGEALKEAVDALETMDRPGEHRTVRRRLAWAFASGERSNVDALAAKDRAAAEQLMTAYARHLGAEAEREVSFGGATQAARAGVEVLVRDAGHFALATRIAAFLGGSAPSARVTVKPWPEAPEAIVIAVGRSTAASK